MLLEQLQGLSETERRKILDALSKSIKWQRQLKMSGLLTRFNKKAVILQ
jgi:hypothetical protein